MANTEINIWYSARPVPYLGQICHGEFPVQFEPQQREETLTIVDTSRKGLEQACLETNIQSGEVLLFVEFAAR